MLDCLGSDLSSFLNARDMAELAEESGITDFRAAQRLWDALSDTRDKLNALLGEPEARALAFDVVRL